MDNASFTSKGLKCDTEGCGYRDETIPFEDFPKYLNAPCPKCGASLLNQADYDALLNLHGLIAALNTIPILNKDEPRFSMTGSFDGSGTIKFKDLKVIPPIKGS